MKTIIKIMFTKNHIFRLKYCLSVKKGEFFIDAYLEKFEKNLFYSNGEAIPQKKEFVRERLPKMSFIRAISLFEKLSENLIFPDRLSEFIEDAQAEFDEFIPVS